MDWNNPKHLEETIMSSGFKSALSSTATTVVNTIPQAAKLVEVGVTVAASWLLELHNEVSSETIESYKKTKQLMNEI